MSDVYSLITDKIVAALEAGVKPWHKPWTPGCSVGLSGRPLRSNGQPYQGINVLMLWLEASSKGYSSRYWFTYKQANDLGANVRKGERGTLVVYFNRTLTKDKKTGEEKVIPILKSYTVFNANQIDGLNEMYYNAQPVEKMKNERNEAIDEFFAATGATLAETADKACYIPSMDMIGMPSINSFDDANSYYATLAHEFIHWTSPKSRLDRSFGTSKFGNEAYAMEELVAELGSAFLSADLGIIAETPANHASYIASWLKVLKNDKTAVFKAASFAQKAADYIGAYSHTSEVAEAA